MFIQKLKGLLKFPGWAIVFVFLCLVPRSGGAASGNLRFSVSFDKSEYAPEEPINVTFVLTNDGKSPVYVNKRFTISSEEAPKNQKEVTFILTSPSGKKMLCKYTYETGYPKTDYFELLEPGKEVKSEYPRNLRGFFDLTEEGTYKAVAVYQNMFGGEVGLDVFKDKLTSSPVSFKIAKPKGTQGP